MKNKLLLSSALISGLMVGGSAIAQTTISGDLAIAFKSQSYDASAGVGSKRGFGRESQVNVQNKGKLSNGMNYAAGFSLEFDGNARTNTTGATSISAGTEANSISNENVYIDIEITPGTTITAGVDHIQNITREIPQVLSQMDNVAAGLGSLAVNGVGANPKENFGIGIVQVIPGTGLTASYNYTPNGGDFGLTDQTADATSNGRNSAYEYGIVGVNAFGVQGLGLSFFKNNEDKDVVSGTSDIEGTAYTISYAAKGFTGGYSEHKQNRESAAATADKELKMKQIAVTYAATKDITIGLSQLKTENETATKVDETIRSLQIGYNLGPVALVVSASDAEDVANTAGNDAKEIGIRLSTKF
jgi:hypothetical protein